MCWLSMSAVIVSYPKSLSTITQIKSGTWQLLGTIPWHLSTDTRVSIKYKLTLVDRRGLASCGEKLTGKLSQLSWQVTGKLTCGDWLARESALPSLVCAPLLPPQVPLCRFMWLFSSYLCWEIQICTGHSNMESFCCGIKSIVVLVTLAGLLSASNSQSTCWQHCWAAIVSGGLWPSLLPELLCATSPKWTGLRMRKLEMGDCGESDLGYSFVEMPARYWVLVLGGTWSQNV